MNSKALLRMIEAVLAAIVILLAFTVSYHYATPPNPFAIRAKGDLEKMAYDVLHRLAEEKALDEVVEKNDPTLLGDEFAAALRTLLPKNIVYNLTIYNATRIMKYTNMTIRVEVNTTNQGGIWVNIISPSGEIITPNKWLVGNGSTSLIVVEYPELGNWTLTVEWNVAGNVNYSGVIRGFKEGAWSLISDFDGKFEIGVTQGRIHEYYFWLYDVKLDKLCSVTNIENPEAMVKASEVGEAILTYTYSQLKGRFYTLVLHLTVARVER
jgi:hypothetical protein